MGYLSCHADSSIATCRSISSSDVTSRTPHRRKKKNSNLPKSSAPPNDVPNGAGGEAHDFSHPNICHFTYGELESATANFSDGALLGRGSHGAVYKAVLRSGRQVAVKRPSRRPHLLSSPSPSPAAAPARDEVENEIEILSGIRSPRLVNLIGFTPSDDRRERLLVVEFMPNGTLYDLLHSNPRPPGWARRLRLALQTAKALLTLHSAQPPVIHRDVKSANVLIDQDSNARLADFGLALRDDDDAAADGKFPSSARSTPPAGTLGYLDPSYVTPESLSTKTDVFSFGILLLEIMSGRKAIDVAHSPPSVVEWAVPLLRKGKVSTLFDPRIAPPKNPLARKQLASLAASCVRSLKEMRPSMDEVVGQLKVLSKTVPSRAWNGLSVGNPCSVVDVERTLTKLNSSSTNQNHNLCSDSRIHGEEEPITTRHEEMPVHVRKLPSTVKGSRSLSNSRRGSTNLLNLMAQPNGELKGESTAAGNGNGSPAMGRAKALRLLHDFYERDAIWQSRRQAKDSLKSSWRVDEKDAVDEKAHG
ncbi:STYKc [Musa troglodytarum]|uniref:STYKc n=2 Tax=Musa troglodytarum TaxID=320322 RepID=A0A9E7F0J9_9LILI|nr:STYKc [Musa troglodytarum]